MKTDIKFLLEQDYGYIFSMDNDNRIRIPSLVYGPEFQQYSTKRKSFYVSYFENLKKELSDILNVSEHEYKRNRKKVISDTRKDSIAMAILAMRNQLFKEAQYDKMEKVYKAGYDVPSKIFDKELNEEVRNNKQRLDKIKDDFDNDVERFIGEIADRVDGVIDDHELKSKSDSSWEWVALMGALFGDVSALEYRLKMIAIEPFRLAYRAGVLDGINKILHEKNMEVKKYIWEATGENPCDQCIALDGTEVSWEEVQQFAHPNCQCTITLIVG